MRPILLFMIIAMLGNKSMQAQEITNQFILSDEPYFLPDSGKTDSIPPAPKRKLLPDNMSFMERGLWGEQGVLRGIGIASPLTPEVRKHELGIRRTMLTVHQIGGFVTLGLMGTALYYGQQILNNPGKLRSSRISIYNHDPYGNNYYTPIHQTLVTATIISYAATGLLAVLSPPPLIRRNEVSTTTIHKTLAWVHFAGMVVTPILGMSLRHSLNPDQMARFHQISAYITTATFAASMIIITF
jgi:hypothetical protein